MHSTEAVALMLIALGAYIMPMISRRLMLPSAVAEFFYGMAIGALILGDQLAVPEPIKFLSELGFILLMYIAGLELDFDRVRALKKRDYLSYTLYAIILSLGSIAASQLAGMPPYFALVILTSAIGLLFAVLNELNLIKTKLGQTLILMGVLGELITLIGITVVTLVAKSSSSHQTVREVVGIAIFVTIVFFVMRIIRLLLWWYPDLKRLFMSVGNPSEIGIRANLFNMFLFVMLASFANLEVILGAFLGGVIFATQFAEREEMLERLSGFGYGFLIPIFFIEVGSRFKFSDFANTEVLKGAIILTLLIFIVRVLASLPMLLTGISYRQLIYLPFGLSFPLTLLVAASTIGENAGLINKMQASIIILTAVMGAILFPWIIKMLFKAIPIEEE